MKNRDRIDVKHDHFLGGIRIVKEKLVGETYPFLETNKCRLIMVKTFEGPDKKMKDEVKLLHPMLDMGTDRDEYPPVRVFEEVNEEWARGAKKGKYHVLSLRYANEGVQVVVTVGGSIIEGKRSVEKEVVKKGHKMIEKGEETFHNGWNPFFEFNQKVPFQVYYLHVHRYDAANPEVHLEVVQNDLSVFFRKPAEDFKIMAWVQTVFAKLQSLNPDQANDLKVLMHKHITGYAKKADIGPRQDETLKKFNHLAFCIQKNGVNVFGETGLAVFWGVANFAEEYWMDGTLGNDLISNLKNKNSGRDKLDQAFSVLLEAIGEKLP